MADILLATHNSGKIKEFSDILGGSGIKIRSLAELGLKGEIVDENSDTYEGNAWLKAKTIGDQKHCEVLAEDSGIELEALDGKPGIHSARFAKGSDLDRCHHMLRVLEGKQDRKAKYVCVIVYYNPSTGERKSFRGECCGVIATKIEGNMGFGYDPLFIPEGYNETMAVLGPTVKNQISHRTKAIRAFRDWWDSRT